jgi:multiple sugar transport system substrate-binding protein
LSSEYEQERAIQQLAEGLVTGRMSRDELLRRTAALGISVSAVAGALAGGASAARRADEVDTSVSGTITVVANVGPGAENKAWKARTAAFVKKFPNVTVKDQNTVGATFYDTLPKVETMLAGGKPPDVVRTGNYTTALFGARNALVPLDSLIKGDKSLNWLDFNARARQAMMVNGKVYALPENNESYAIHYDASAFKAKGLPDPRKQWQQGTWTKDAFLKAAQALTEGSGPRKKFGFLYETWNSENWIFFNGGKVLAPDGKTVLVDKPAAYNGIQFAADLVTKYKVAPNAAELAGRAPYALFPQGVARMYLAGGWFIANFASTIKDFDYATTGPPIMKPGLKTAKMEISGYAITRQSKNKEAAWEYVKFITGREGQKIWSVVGMPSRNSAIKDFQASDLAKWYKPFIQLLPAVEFTPFEAKSAEVAQELTSGLDAVWLGQRSARDATADVAKKLRALLK